ncbi:MAG: DNA polymerase III subunit delta [Chloroflexota bacterium]
MPDTASILLLHGNDDVAIREHLQALQARLDPSSADMNLSRLDGRGLSLDDLNTAVNAMPFLSPLRLVILTNPGAVPREKLTDLLDKAPETTLLAMVADEALKAEHWLVKWTARAGPRAEVRLYAMPRLWELPAWIVKDAKKQGGQIEQAAAARLAEMVGEDTRLAAQEITKLLTYVNYARAVTLEDVGQVSAASAGGNIFALVDALGNKNGKAAQQVLHHLLEEGDPFDLWFMVIRQFRLLLLAREIIDRRGRVADIQKALGLHDFVAKKVSGQAQNFTLPTLEAIYHQLLDIDEGVKTGQLTIELALDLLVVELSRK